MNIRCMNAIYGDTEPKTGADVSVLIRVVQTPFIISMAYRPQGSGTRDIIIAVKPADYGDMRA